jgi:superfamily II DNA or RNA helicase
VSGSFGSRQEEAQRLGRILRPKAGANEAYFYSIVSRDTKEQEFTMKRQLFLVEQGYAYRIVEAGAPDAPMEHAKLRSEDQEAPRAFAAGRRELASI